MKILTAAARCVPAALIFACSWILSCQPSIAAIPNFFGADKIVHFFCFAGLSFWVAFAVPPSLRAKPRAALSVAIVSLYGVIDEIHQSFTPGRDCSVFDWMADTLGALAGAAALVALCALVARRRGRTKSVNLSCKS